MVRRTIPSLALAALIVLPGLGLAQEKPKADAGKEGAADRPVIQGVALRVQLVISRFQGDKKLASFPYTIVATTGGGPTRMRLGVDTPVATLSGSDGKQTTTIQYRTVGTNIDCQARDWGEGRYLLNIGVENSSALPLEKGPSSGGAPPAVDANPTGSPLFRRFDTNVAVLLRDGQSVQTTASTDPVTGELVKIDVTMNVVR
jgi:hypothetical protein